MGPRRLGSSLPQHITGHCDSARFLDVKMAILAGWNRSIRLVRYYNGWKSRQGLVASSHTLRILAPILHSSSHSLLSETGTGNYRKDTSEQTRYDNGSALSSTGWSHPSHIDGTHTSSCQSSRRRETIMIDARFSQAHVQVTIRLKTTKTSECSEPR